MPESEYKLDTANSAKERITLRHFKKVNNPRSIHGIYPYRGKMSAIDASHVISQLSIGSTLLDPFCGTGTIVYEAQIHGMNAIGVDNNPLACVVASGKTQPIDKVSTLSDLDTAINEAQSLSNVPCMPDTPAQFFHEDTADQIMRVQAVSRNFSPYLLSSFYGSMCLAARACNQWLWTSTSIGKINTPLKRVDFYSMLQRKTRKHIDYVQGTPPAQVYAYDVRKIEDVVPPKSIDFVYTSPPYFDALDYTGYYTKIVMDIIEMDRSLVRNGLIQRYSTYKREMKRALNAIDRVLHEKSMIIFVVGDRMVHGKFIRGSDLFKEIAPWKEPYIVEREYTNTASSLWDKINMTTRKEQVIVWDLSQGGRKQ
ncbi:hypothetical protein EU527_11955 [Candidatus Thorarchaeota archaeon]|nr:MAG: hypothetical protein EU527_11955 [Candidatus Thorarchaeota archaeon]